MELGWVKDELGFQNRGTLRFFHFSEEFHLLNVSPELGSLAAPHTPGGAAQPSTRLSCDVSGTQSQEEDRTEVISVHARLPVPSPPSLSCVFSSVSKHAATIVMRIHSENLHDSHRSISTQLFTSLLCT